jgi:L-threonylcarbamoyladenylate synthase
VKTCKRIDPEKPQPVIIQAAAGCIHTGGVVAFPTSCLYGLGADAFNVDAVDKVFRLKQRPYNKPLSVLIKSVKDLDRLVRRVTPAAETLMDHFWPGRITLIFDARDTLPANLTSGTGKIGVRLPAHPVASALVNSLNGPITATSANLSGQPGCSQITDLADQMVSSLDLILDAGTLKGGHGSTVIDATGDSFIILREGSIPSEDIFRILGKTSE